MRPAPTIKPINQDIHCLAWEMLCSYIDTLVQTQNTEFVLHEAFATDKERLKNDESYAKNVWKLQRQIRTFPKSIAKLTHIKELFFYGSSIRCVPPEIGQMVALENFDPYTSYNLHWFPYEMVYCQHIKESTVSTRAIYGNYKNRPKFPDLTHNPVQYFDEYGQDKVYCSICKKEMSYQQTNQFWVSKYIGTDTLPLLANICSDKCLQVLIIQNTGEQDTETFHIQGFSEATNAFETHEIRHIEYLRLPHKGGDMLIQPAPDEGDEEDNEMFYKEMRS